jgi:DNA-binding HxlR family transcriptional regulator
MNNGQCSDTGERTICTEATIDALRRLEGKWKLVILSELFSAENLRFSELERAIYGVTQKMLIQQLKQLEKDGIVRRTVYPQVPPKVEYSLTDFGHALAPAMIALRKWAQEKPSSSETIISN